MRNLLALFSSAPSSLALLTLHLPAFLPFSIFPPVSRPVVALVQALFVLRNGHGEGLEEAVPDVCLCGGDGEGLIVIVVLLAIALSIAARNFFVIGGVCEWVAGMQKHHWAERSIFPITPAATGWERSIATEFPGCLDRYPLNRIRRGRSSATGLRPRGHPFTTVSSTSGWFLLLTTLLPPAQWGPTSGCSWRSSGALLDGLRGPGRVDLREVQLQRIAHVKL